ncbi:hypothetical protein HPB51_013004 [Rhipicephalus microplus]|uniref:Uncharacterized protein n=1 Tax=Rhipicephalus microplus TaxID=6941 RepID=A0A9J6F259_RHIMP|nr:hypothetical protein HPB51_013004 [Rhipicephalus microplus]
MPDEGDRDRKENEDYPHSVPFQSWLGGALDVKTKLLKCNCNLVVIPGGMTPVLQFLDKWQCSLSDEVVALLQNTSSSWDTVVPSVSPCFEHTVLVWLPCSFAWLLGICEASILVHSDNRDNSYSTLFVTKLVDLVPRNPGLPLERRLHITVMVNSDQFHRKRGALRAGIMRALTQLSDLLQQMDPDLSEVQVHLKGKELALSRLDDAIFR